MPVAALENVSLAYGHVPLLDRVALSLNAGEKVALIGRNGTGKSSLLKLLAGVAAPDDGEVWRQPGLRVSWVAQEPELGAGQSVFEAAADGLGEVRRLLADYEAAAHAVEAGDTDTLGDLERLGTQLDAMDGWRLKSRVDGVLTRLGLVAETSVSALSGGQRKRLALARALVAEPELLLLDEPTNHLDVSSIEWLEELLGGFTGALLFVTHDRVFLDRVADRIVELDRGRLANFPGSFAAYRGRKEQQLAEESVQQEKFDRVLAQEEAWIRRGVEARRTRDAGRVRRLEQLRRERAARRDRIGSVDLTLEEGERSGKLVAELTHVNKAFDGKTVVRDLSCRILRGDKVGLIGPNAAGKTTLIRLILGDLAPDAGQVRLGTKLAIAYFDQFRAQLDDEASVFETVGQGSDYIEVAGTRKHVMSYLGEFLFPPERVRSPVKSLSGGERNRLLLARLFAKSANVLVLDEPTNDLDLESLELLEGLLQEYTGTVLLVSHDRAFLDNVVTQVIAYDGDGRWIENPGGYQEWARVLSARASRVAAEGPVERSNRAEPARAARQAKLTYNEAQELKALPTRIETLEREQAELGRRLADPDLYRSDPEQVKTAKVRYSQLDELLLQLLARWEDLENKQSKAPNLAQ
jgi:ABC transport system ATP-binding/permease protein